MRIRYYNNETSYYTRCGRQFIVQHGLGVNDHHYYIAISFNKKRLSAWRRISLTRLNKLFKEL